MVNEILLCLAVLKPVAIAHAEYILPYDHNNMNMCLFRYISGSLHYSRVPSYYWKDRLQKMYAAGLNAVQTYVPWNFHEPTPGLYRFDGDRDLVQFIKTAQEVGLLVILRAGPYICAEWEMGGLPSWLLTIKPTIALRTSDPVYLFYVDQWLSTLLPLVGTLLYENGGPIITVQVENEYGSYFACDKTYMTHLEGMFRQFLGQNVVLFTTDGPAMSYFDCGAIPSLYATVDFGVTSNPMQYFDAQRQFEPHGPLVNSEYYTGWLDFWGQPHQTVDSNAVAEGLDAILKLNANVNMYMFEGGTSFGFWNGADTSDKYMPQPTSYDYNAPLTEAGDPWEKFALIKQVISKYQPVPPYIPPATPKTAYGNVQMVEYAWLLESPQIITKNITSNAPATMEVLEQSFGHVVYTTTGPLPSQPAGCTLTLLGVHDRAVVYVDAVLQGILTRVEAINANLSLVLKSSIASESQMVIIVENMGRINYGSMINDFKGILYGVEINGIPISGWTSQSVPLNDTTKIPFQKLAGENVKQSTAFFRGFFSGGSIPNDTFLSLPGWTKGQAFINGVNLGRYWPVEGPQKTLYVPANVLKGAPSLNELILFEIDNAPCLPPFLVCYVTFVSTPDIGN